MSVHICLCLYAMFVIVSDDLCMVKSGGSTVLYYAISYSYIILLAIAIVIAMVCTAFNLLLLQFSHYR